MFTGIIQTLGKVAAFRKNRLGGVLQIQAARPLSKPKLGESIAINGCCLTLTKASGKNLSFDLSEETLKKTSFKTLQKGSVVNLERALKLGDAMGGHWVMGHVDGLACVTGVNRKTDYLVLSFSIPKQLSRYLIDKGSVTLNGVSLTVSNLKGSRFSVYIIPHTEEETNLGSLKKGNVVNLEVDVLGKYVERLMK